MQSEVLMPVREAFIEVFGIFMDEKQKNKIRANNVRQYVEGIVDLLLKDKILLQLKQTERYENINWKRKIEILHDNYNSTIVGNIQEIFKIGGAGSHFNGKVQANELREIIDLAVHIVEDIFVVYFLSPEHRFGTENIFTIFSMLPLKHRIYILEKILDDQDNLKNEDVIDRLSLAYAKNGDGNKALELLDKALKEKRIGSFFHQERKESIRTLMKNIDELYSQNPNYEWNNGCSEVIVERGRLVVGLPTSKDILDTAKAVEIFNAWFEEGRDNYPEFINLFFYLMKTDERQYK